MMNYNQNKILKMFKDAPLKLGQDFYEGLNNDLFSSINFDNNNYYCDNGASKLAIISITGDYVIKIPYTGQFPDDSFWNPTEEEFNEWFEHYTGAGGENPWDYCALEVKRYQFAKQFGFHKYLAEIKLLGYINGYPIYIQEKCETYLGTKTTRHTDKEKALTRSICGMEPFEYLTNDNWLTDFRLYYGEEELINFVKFLKTYHWDDLNNSNIGYLRGCPVILDFSGFEE